MLIRSATATDIPAMMAVEHASVTAAHWPEHQYEAAFADSTIRIALAVEQDAKLQGFLIARSIGDEWELENIAVLGPARRRVRQERRHGQLRSGESCCRSARANPRSRLSLAVPASPIRR